MLVVWLMLLMSSVADAKAFSLMPHAWEADNTTKFYLMVLQILFWGLIGWITLIIGGKFVPKQPMWYQTAWTVSFILFSVLFSLIEQKTGSFFHPWQWILFAAIIAGSAVLLGSSSVFGD